VQNLKTKSLGSILTPLAMFNAIFRIFPILVF